MSLTLQDWAQIDKKVMDVAKTGMSDPSEPGSVVVAADALAPSAPTFSIAAEPGALVLTLTKPTTKIDEKALNNFREFAIYHSTGSGIDISDDGTYDGIIYSSSTSVEHKCTVETFFRVTALNTFSVESLPSAEASETPDGAAPPPADIPTVATGLVFDGNPKIGDGIIGLLLLDQATTWVLFSYWEIQYALSTNSGADWGAWTALTKTTKFGYLHKGISTAAGYRYKYRGRPVGEDGVGSTTWDESDNSGDGWPNAGTWGSDNSALVAETVLAENIIAVNEVRGDSIKATTTITAGTGNDVGVLDGADGTYRIYAGHATPASAPFKVTKAGGVTCTNLTITGGSININSGVFTVSTLGAVACSNLAITGGTINVNAGVFSVSALGAVACSNLSITGGSIDLNGSVFKVDALGQVTCSNIQITGAGSTWGGAVLGTSYIPNLSTDKLTTGILVVDRTAAKCTDELADETAAHDCQNPGDYTTTIIDGGLITTGTIQFKDGAAVTKAGMTAAGTGDANIRIWAGDTYANRATAAFRVSQGGSVVCSDLTISGGSIDLNGSVFKVDALGQVTCSNIQITGAGSTWGGAKIAQANIANLTTAIITSGTFDAVRIPNLSTDKLTTGTLLVGRTQAKCTDANADQTSANTASGIAGQGDLATLDVVETAKLGATVIVGGYIKTGLVSADNITTGTLLVGRTQAKCTDANADQTSVNETYGSGAEVRAGTGWSHASNTTLIDGGDIYANTVTVDKLYIADDMNFYGTGARHGIKGIDDIFTSTTKSTTEGHIVFGVGGGLELDAGTTAGHDLSLNSPDNIVLTPGSLNTEAVVGVMKYVNTVVFNANAVGTSYTLMNLSSYLAGSRRCLCFLRVVNNGGSQNSYYFKPYDESENQATTADDFPGACCCRSGYTDELSYVWALTDTSGRLYWKSNDTDSVTITLMGYFVMTAT